jgi:methyl-accepting chemotaxis protein
MKHARHRRVIDRKLQFRMIAVSLTIVVGGLLLFAAIAVLVTILAGGASAAPLPERLLVILPPLLINDIAIMVLIVVVGIFTSHRIAGPVHRMTEDISRTLSGERGVRVRLRRRDAFPELAEKVNVLLERIDETRKG